MFLDFKKMLIKHNEAMNFKLQKLIDEINAKKNELITLDTQIRERKDQLAALPEK
jgi:low affinity Fe/Cu permease